MFASEILKAIRIQLNITQEELAHYVHTTTHTVNLWEDKINSEPYCPKYY